MRDTVIETFRQEPEPCTPGLLKAAARQRLAAGRGVLELGLDTGAPGGPLPIISSGGRRSLAVDPEHVVPLMS